MADEVQVTPLEGTPPVEGQATAGETQPQEQEAASQAETQPGGERTYTSAEVQEIMRYQATNLENNVKTFIGRKMKSLEDYIESRVAAAIPHAQPQGPGEDPAETLLKDPGRFIQDQVVNTISKMAKGEQEYTGAVIAHAGQIMDSEPLLVDRKFGNEVLRELQSSFPVAVKQAMKRGIPAELVANAIVKDSMTNVIRREKMSKQNPFAGRSPTRTPLGGVAPNKITPSAPPVKISALAAQKAKEWGYTDADLAKVFKDK